MANPTIKDIRAAINAKGELSLRVVPRTKVERAAIENGILKLWTRTAAEDGKATKSVLVQLANLFEVSPRQVTLLSGATSRDKRVKDR